MPARWLKRNHGTEGPANLLFFDSETIRKIIAGPPRHESHKLRLWSATALRLEDGKVTRRQLFQGTTADQFWSVLQSRLDRRRPLWAFAHNLGFDLTQLHFWRELEAKRFTAGPVPRPPSRKTGKPRGPWRGMLCLEARPTYAVVRHDRGTVRFVDTGNFWPSSLASMGKSYGLEKLAMPPWEAPDDEWFAYCRRDVEVTERAVLGLLERWKAEDCGTFKMTAPALAMAHFRHHCPERTAGEKAVAILCEPNAPHHELERASYYGGRVQPFYLGVHAGPIHHLDVCSLYLAVMASEAYPTRRRKMPACQSPAELLDRLRGFGVVAKVRINSRTATYPVRFHNVQQHCCGVFDTVLCGAELERALINGDVESVGENHSYVLGRPFASWARYWFDKKADAEARGEQGRADLDFAKLLGNSLSGKWAQRGRHWKDCKDQACVMPWGDWLHVKPEENITRRFRGVGGHTQELVEGDEPEHSFPLISAYIAGYGREVMRDLFRMLPSKSLLYTATDSLLVTDAGLRALEVRGLVGRGQLGKLNHKGSYSEAEVCGSNWYRLGEQWYIAGWYGKRRANADGVQVAQIWQQLPSVIRSRPDGTIRVSEMEMLPQVATPKGTVDAEGWVQPFRVSLDPDFSDHPRPPKVRFIP